MAQITNTWADPQMTTLRSHMQGQITWELYNEAVDEIAAMLKGFDHPVYLITTSSEDYAAAKGNAFPHIKRFYLSLPSCVKLHIMVGMNPFERLVWSMYLRLNKEIRLIPRFAADFNEAQAMIRREQRDATLPMPRFVENR